MTGRAAHCTAAAVPRVRYSASPSDYRLVIVTMIPRLLCLLFCWDVAVHVGRAQKLPGVKKTSLKVQINATGDTVNLKFLRPSPNIKLEGFILGYGSNFFSTQYIPLPENGKFYDTELDAEPRYLIAVHPSPVVNSKKNCAGQTKVQKPLQVVVGTLTPTSVYLAWGVLVNPQYDWTVLNKCLTDRFYTVRYREKEKNKKWLFHFCPNTETVIDNLKPNVIYEFGVKDNSEDGTWNKGVAHKTTAPPKHKINGGNGHIQNTYSAPKGHIQVAPEDTKMHIPITMIKQVVQNISIPKKDTSVKPPVPPAKIAVNDTQQTRAIPGTSEEPVAPQTKTVQGMMPESLKTRTFNPTEKTGPTQAVHQTIQETRTDIPDISPKLPDSTPVSNEPTIFPFKEVTSAAAEIQELKPASTRQNIPETITPKSSRSEEQPKATLAFQETPFSSSEPKDVEIPEIPPTNPVYWTSPTPATTKPTRAPQRPSKATHGPKEPSFIPFKYTTSVRPHRPQSTLVPKSTHRMPINLIRLHIFEDPKFSLVPNETQKSSFKPTSQTTEISHAKAASKEQYIDSIEPTLSVPHQKLETTHVPKSTHRMPINLIRLHIFEDPKMSLVPNETQKSSSKPTSQTTEISHAKAASEELYIDPIEPKLSIPHQKLETTHAPKKVHSSSSRPKSSVRPRTRPASEELFIDPIEPKLSVPHQKLETTHAPKKVHSSSSRPKPSVRPRTRPVPNRTTQATARPKSSNDLNWISETSIGAKLTGQDGTKLLGVSRNTSMEPNGTVKRPASGSSHPGTPRATLTPARPTHMRRRPFYPYNVTGRPRISGNGLVPRAPSSSIRHVPRPTRVPIVERTQTPRTKTTAAPEPPTVTEPVFNTNPVSELDPMGKPRYTAPHVKYMRKEDLVPCSITESMKHFPNELATNVDEATTPPQNSPSNLTVIAVEGCPSFVILDWKEPDNDTVTEYKVISKENGGTSGKDQSILRTNQTHSTVENLKPNTSYEFKVLASNILGEGPPSTTVTHSTESVDPRVSEPITGGKDAIWTEIKFKSDTYSECKGKQYVKRTWYKKFVGIQLCNSLRYKIYLSDSLGGKFYNIGDESGYGEDHCQFVDSFLDGRTGQRLLPEQLPSKEGFYRSVRQQPVEFGKMGSQTHIRYVQWYECGTTIPGKW
ncbi:target of Nesh-SH3 isoform X3 [Lissotriton helveticus]